MGKKSPLSQTFMALEGLGGDRWGWEGLAHTGHPGGGEHSDVGVNAI